MSNIVGVRVPPSAPASAIGSGAAGAAACIRARTHDCALTAFGNNGDVPHLPNPNPVRPGPGPEQRLRNLQRRFRAVSARHDRAIRLRRVMRAATAIVAIAVALAVIWGLGSSPWPVTTTLRHIASAPNCGFARMVGLAPAGRGEPGYWKHHDHDGDGVACEPWLPQRGAVTGPILT